MLNVEAVFRIGEKVRLNSGSPELTVVGVDNDRERVTVEWHGGDDLERSTLPSACFSLVSAPK
jgi:uncharacterized protein YodC (DUF2158 family)